MIYMKDLFMVWIIVIVFLYNPSQCRNEMKLFSTLSIGQYKMIFNQIRKCNSSQEYKIEHNYNVFRTENSTILKGNIIFLIPFDDTLFMEINIAMRDSFGKWKDNTFIQKSPKACSTLKQGYGNSWNKYLKNFGIKNNTCPIAPGFYTGSGMDMSVYKDTNFPQQLIYGTYKLRVSYTRNNEIFGCNIYIYEIRRL